ncbi:MAG: VOC family protein [Planctomycetota bacterium]
MFNSLDHIAIVVQNIDEALGFYRDQLGLPVVVDEIMEDAGVRLTHLDFGNVHLQLVQPIRDDHPLQQHLNEKGEGLHHLCFHVDNVEDTLAKVPERDLIPMNKPPHSGPNGRQAAFLDPASTRGVTWEITAARRDS